MNIIKIVFCLLLCVSKNTSAAEAQEVRDQLKLRHRLEGHAGPVRAALYLPTGKIATGSDDTTIRVWDFKSQKCLHVLKGHTKTVTCLASLLPDGAAEAIISGSEDGRVGIWALGDGKLIKIFKYGSNPIRSLAKAMNGYVVLQKDQKNHVEYHPIKGKLFRRARHESYAIVYEGEPDPAVEALRNGIPEFGIAPKPDKAKKWNEEMVFIRIDNSLKDIDVPTYCFLLNTSDFLSNGDEAQRNPKAVLEKLKKIRPNCSVEGLVFLSDGNAAVRTKGKSVQIMSDDGGVLQEIGYEQEGFAMAAAPGGGLMLGSAANILDIFLYDAAHADAYYSVEEKSDEGVRLVGGKTIQKTKNDTGCGCVIN